MPPPAPLRVALVGYGGFGQFLHRAWQGVPDVLVTVVASDVAPPPDSPVADVVPAWQDAVGRADVDLVAVATPPALHAPVGVAALEAGHHLLVEKPLATTLADADRLIAARDRARRPDGTPCVAAVDFLLRHTPVAEALVRWAGHEPFGRLVRVALENEAQDESLPAGHWFWDRQVSGGILVEHAVHFLDLVNAAVAARGDDPAHAQVQGAASRRADGREDRVLALVHHARGPLATHAHAFTRPAAFERTTMRWTFERADVDVEGWIPLGGTVRAALRAPGDDHALETLPGWRETRRHPADGTLTLVEGTFGSGQAKGDAYADAARAVLADLARAARDPRHVPRTSLEAGREALRQALAARDDADTRAA